MLRNNKYTSMAESEHVKCQATRHVIRRFTYLSSDSLKGADCNNKKQKTERKKPNNCVLCVKVQSADYFTFSYTLSDRGGPWPSHALMYSDPFRSYESKLNGTRFGCEEVQAWATNGTSRRNGRVTLIHRTAMKTQQQQVQVPVQSWLTLNQSISTSDSRS